MKKHSIPVFSLLVLLLFSFTIAAENDNTEETEEDVVTEKSEEDEVDFDFSAKAGKDGKYVVTRIGDKSSGKQKPSGKIRKKDSGKSENKAKTDIPSLPKIGDKKGEMTLPDFPVGELGTQGNREIPTQRRDKGHYKLPSRPKGPGKFLETDIPDIPDTTPIIPGPNEDLPEIEIIESEIKEEPSIIYGDDDFDTGIEIPDIELKKDEKTVKESQIEEIGRIPEREPVQATEFDIPEATELPETTEQIHEEVQQEDIPNLPSIDSTDETQSASEIPDMNDFSPSETESAEEIEITEIVDTPDSSYETEHMDLPDINRVPPSEIQQQDRIPNMQTLTTLPETKDQEDESITDFELPDAVDVVETEQQKIPDNTLKTPNIPDMPDTSSDNSDDYAIPGVADIPNDPDRSLGKISQGDITYRNISNWKGMNLLNDAGFEDSSYSGKEAWVESRGILSSGKTESGLEMKANTGSNFGVVKTDGAGNPRVFQMVDVRDLAEAVKERGIALKAGISAYPLSDNLEDLRISVIARTESGEFIKKISRKISTEDKKWQKSEITWEKIPEDAGWIEFRVESALFSTSQYEKITAIDSGYLILE